MTQWHMKSKRRPSGGLRHSVHASDKKLSWKGGMATLTTMTTDDKGKENEVSRVKGGISKVRAKKTAEIMVSSGNKAKKAKIISVIENKSNRQYARRNIITKGAILKVELDGKELFVKVTNRPGQSGSVFGTQTEWVQEETKAKKVKAALKKSEGAGKHEALEGKPEKAAAHDKEKAEKHHKKAK